MVKSDKKCCQNYANILHEKLYEKKNPNSIFHTVIQCHLSYSIVAHVFSPIKLRLLLNDKNTV